MRIVGGIWKGRQLDAPTGRDTRPTTDRVREAMASMLLSACNLSIEGINILDAFAGSGAISFELLSRGAAHATLVDKSRKSCLIIHKNASRLGAEHQVDVLCGDVVSLLERGRMAREDKFSLLILDPPYAMSFSEVASLIKLMREAEILESDALVLYEHADTHESFSLSGATIEKHKNYGDTVVDLLRIR